MLGNFRQGVKQKIKSFQKKLSPHSIILMYHRIIECERDIWGLAVTPTNFEAQLQVLQKSFTVMTLSDLALAQVQGQTPNRAVAITFDDGYIDNLVNAKPILTKYNVPATIFIATGYIGKQQEFWWDDLERLLLTPGLLPEILTLKLDENLHTWDLSNCSEYTLADSQGDRTRRAWEGQPGSRLAIYQAIWKFLQPLPDKQQQDLIQQIIEQIRATQDYRPANRPMTGAELLELTDNGLIEIGAHTIDHPALSAHSQAIQTKQINTSKKTLEELLNRSVNNFAYPFGDYNQMTPQVVKNAGFTCACSTVAETVWRNSSQWELPRFAVENWNGAEFAEQLEKWLEQS
jgi:peptidoglycan/xylan/chitin deacetylase (PgdA/CDA1 family)